MKILLQVLYMYAVAAAISFFVAFLIKALFVFIKRREQRKNMFARITEELSLPKSWFSSSSVESIIKEAESLGKEGEIFAAISFALHLYQKEMHDNENLRITINKAVKPYSPWSSKIYSTTPWRR
jgi:hypothetical protein